MDEERTRQTRVSRVQVRKQKHVVEELQAHLDELTSAGWDVVSVLPEDLQARSVGFGRQRVTGFLVVSTR